MSISRCSNYRNLIYLYLVLLFSKYAPLLFLVSEFAVFLAATKSLSLLGWSQGLAPERRYDFFSQAQHVREGHEVFAKRFISWTGCRLKLNGCATKSILHLQWTKTLLASLVPSLSPSLQASLHIAKLPSQPPFYSPVIVLYYFDRMFSQCTA
jgi:hypothetical protein